jgi:tetratricopeptide (TPR) repeat protein
LYYQKIDLEYLLLIYTVQNKRDLKIVRIFTLLFAILIISSCSVDKSRVTDPKDYDLFLRTDNNEAFIKAKKDVDFWSKRLRTDSTGIGDLSQLANSYTKLFDITGNIKYLKDAEILLDKAYSMPSLNNDEYGRSLAHNYIAQHRFNDALQLLETIYYGISNKRLTELMLFDVYLEIGEYDRAYQLLDEFENKEDFDYLIRLVKWNDHMGNSKAVIRNMERAKDIVESRGDKDLMTWTYNNLATVYGHSGRIHESYYYFLKSLEIQPEQVVPKRGIAWIAYSHDRDYSEASRVLDSIMIQHKSPDHLLFRSELAYFINGKIEMEKFRREFIENVENNNDYGFMYQMEMIELYSVLDPKKSIRLAEIELENRTTPVIYSLLSIAHLRNGNSERSLQIIKDHVHGKTFEPVVFYYLALIYNKTGNKDALSDVMEQIEEARFELGPVRIKELSKLLMK